MPEEFLPLLAFYVYVLIDPRDERVFYVGKGTNQRALDHAAQVRQLITAGKPLLSRKRQKIAEIIRAGYEGPKVRVVARFPDEKRAHAVESVLINYVYDYDLQLTNAVRGHDAEFVRRYGNTEILPGIDIPDRVRSHDGSYKDEKIAGLRAAGAYELRQAIFDELTRRNFACRFFEGQPDSKYDPGESNGKLGFLVAVQGVDLLVTVSKSCKPTLFTANTESTRLHAVRLQDMAHLLGEGYAVGAPMNLLVDGEGRYRNFTRPDAAGTMKNANPSFEAEEVEGLYDILERLQVPRNQ